MAHELAGSLQENLLVLLSFDNDRAKIIRGSIELGLFTGIYREISSRIYDYLDKYKKSPGQHIADLMDDKLEDKDKQQQNLYSEFLYNLYSMQDRVNSEYVMNQLGTFVKRQALRSTATDLIKALQTDTIKSLEDAEDLIRKANQRTLTVFNPGIRLSDESKVLNFLIHEPKAYLTGIPELDKRNIGPTKKEMFLYIAKFKSGKTFWLTHLAKMAMMQRLKVLHISLEMSEERCTQRYIQALYSISKRDEKYYIQRFNVDKRGKLEFKDQDEPVKASMHLKDPHIRKKLQNRLRQERGLDNVIIKEFPTGKLTVRELEAHLDNMDLQEHFLPDLLIVDYPDLMKLDHSNFRLSLDQVYKDLRGMAVERNLALAVVSQSNRDSAKGKRTGGENVAEAYSKVAHADCILTYSQTDTEKQYGLARIYVAGTRNDEGGITVAISQGYGMGQYVLDSALMTRDYDSELERLEGEE